MILFERNKDGELVCKDGDKQLYVADKVAIVYSKSVSGCTMLKHGPLGMLREYFDVTRQLMEELEPTARAPVGIVNVKTNRMDELFHAVNTPSVSEECFVALAKE